MLAIVIAFIAIIGAFKFFQIKSAMANMSYQPPPEAVTTVVARQEEWNSTLKAIGTVAAVQGVTVSADLPVSNADQNGAIRSSLAASSASSSWVTALGWSSWDLRTPACPGWWAWNMDNG